MQLPATAKGLRGKVRAFWRRDHHTGPDSFSRSPESRTQTLGRSVKLAISPIFPTKVKFTAIAHPDFSYIAEKYPQ